VRERASPVKGPVIAGLAPVSEQDVDRGAEALEPAERFRIHVFVSTSEIHMREMLRMSEQQVLAAVRESVARAKSWTADAGFAAQDATRTDPMFMLPVNEAAVAARATAIHA